MRRIHIRGVLAACGLALGAGCLLLAGTGSAAAAPQVRAVPPLAGGFHRPDALVTLLRRAPAPDPRDYARELVLARGWSADDFSCLLVLWGRESGWSPTATNPASGAYGIPQALPAVKLASAGPDWRDDPLTQVRWGIGYIASSYGTPCAALTHWDFTGSY